MATTTPPPPPPPIQTTTNATSTSTAYPSANSDGSSTITPGLSSRVKPSHRATPFSPFPPTPDYEDDVHSPSLSSGNASARFEFERLDAKDGRDVGTKVLMVEWIDTEQTRSITGEWSLGWEGMPVAALVPVTTQPEASPTGKEEEKGQGQREQLHRLYFLLPHWQRVPGTVVLTLTPSEQDMEIVTWRTHPLPAIYPPALGNSARASGKRGVLHTIWAKKRLQSLASEIQQEEQNNPEGVSLDLAIQERDWIEQNFGVVTKQKSSDISNNSPANLSLSPNTSAATLNSPSSPKSPGRGPLLEKLKGLRLATGEGDLKGKPDEAGASVEKEHNPLSPETADVAVSWPTFASLNGMGGARDALAAKPAQLSNLQSQQQQQQQQQQAMRTIAPPQSVLEQQRSLAGMSMTSLDAFAAPAASSSEVPFRGASTEDEGFNKAAAAETNEEEDLFALPISPRSPDRGSKKFTFGAEDTDKYVPVSPQ